VGGYQYYAETDIKIAPAQRPFCNNRGQVNATEDSSGNSYDWPQVGVSFIGDLSKTQSYKITYYNLNAGSKDAASGTGTDSNCFAVTPSQTQIQLAAQVQSGPIAGGICSTPGQTSGNLTCGNCASQGCVWTAATSSNSNNDNSCEANYTGPAHELTWLWCPLLRGIDSMFNTIYHTIQGQLSICTGPVSSTTGDKEDCNVLFTPGVEKSWTIFRDISTALLVIVMLIMVFGQAISAGPFDAYTVRKMLPRLAAAAILIQISWFLLLFFVDLSNDLGNGIQSLMLVPFGGAGKLAFDNQIANVGVGAGAVTLASAAVFTGAVLAFSGITIFGWLLIGASAILSVIVGLLVILFRQMLIIMAVMLAPIAFIAYILPGTERYWKLWKDNFIKLLTMFPLIMAMIAGGKIFAYVGSTSSGGSTSFLGLIVVLVGFVGPLWFLPKTFKWGGELFGALANGAWNGTKRIRNYPGTYALEKAKINREERAQDRNARLAEGRSRFPRFDRLMAGGNNYALSRETRERKFEANRAHGRKAREEAATEAIVGSRYEELDHLRKIEALTRVAQGSRDADTGIDGTNNPTLQRWALDELAKYGDWDRISNLRASGIIPERVWQPFVSKNIGAIHQNAPHLSPQRTDLSVLGYEDIGNWKDFEVAEARRQAEQGFTRDAATGGEVHLTGSARTAQLQRWVNFANNALNDEQVRRRLTTDGITDLEAIRALGSTITTPTLQVQGGTRNNPTRVELPTDLGTPEARRSITQAIAQGGDLSSPASTARRVSLNLSQRAADAPVGSPDEQNFVNYLRELEAQAATSPIARSIHNQLVDDFHARLEARVREAEQESLAAGHGPDDIDATVTLEIDHGDQKMDNTGARRI
jgi:hypothetical protein